MGTALNFISIRVSLTVFLIKGSITKKHCGKPTFSSNHSDICQESPPFDYFPSTTFKARIANGHKISLRKILNRYGKVAPTPGSFRPNSPILRPTDTPIRRIPLDSNKADMTTSICKYRNHFSYLFKVGLINFVR